MKKLNILKTIVDLFWIMAIIIMPIIVFTTIYVMLYDASNEFQLNFVNTLFKDYDFGKKMVLIAITFNYLIIIYSLFQFRKILKEFKKTKIFSGVVLKGFNKMGISLILAATISGFTSILYSLIVKNKLEISFEASPLLLLLCFGLFFMVLSEIFKIAKEAKEENELTI